VKVAAKVWRFGVGNTHLCSGSRRVPIFASAARRGPARRDTLIVEFADLGSGVVTACGPDGVVVHFDAHRTARGTAVGARTWRLATADDALRVVARVKEDA
jgi:hypothetical protein